MVYMPKPNKKKPFFNIGNVKTRMHKRKNPIIQDYNDTEIISHTPHSKESPAINIISSDKINDF